MPPGKVAGSNIVHGKRSTYVRGCRCELCKQANTEYGQSLKDRRRTGGKIQPPLAKLETPLPITDDRVINLASVTQIRAGDPASGEAYPDEPGEVEMAVAKEIKSLSAAPKHPGLVQSALAMAKILDNPGAITTHPSAHRQLTVSLDKLWNVSVGRQGKLADVAAMTRRGGKAVNDAD